MNSTLLKSQFVLKGKTTANVADELNVSLTAMYRKMKGLNEFTRKEIEGIISYLELDRDMAMNIFFS